VVTGLRIYTANDAVERDPADYILEGSNNGTTWTQISAGPLALPAERNASAQPLNPETQHNQLVTFANSAAYTSYRVTFTNVKNNATANSMQIAEIELLGTGVGGGEPAITISRTATGITITFDGTLQSATSVTGPFTNVTGAASPYTASPEGEARFYRAVR
jgi:hypothetical protein